MMRILVVEPERKPEIREIDGTLESMQEIVGGLIQAVYPFDEPVALVANDEGKLLGLPLNRMLVNMETRKPYDVIAGTFFLCGAPAGEDHFTSLTEEQVQRYAQVFATPELFLKVNGRLVVLPCE